MIVCLCRGITDREVRRCVRSGALDVKNVAAACGAGAHCRGCTRTLRELVEVELACARATNAEHAAGWAVLDT